VGNNAPFVGLLGTVIGIIRSFHELNATQGKLSDTLMAEVGEALVATAIGIVVAIPAVAFFNFFQRVIKARLGQAETLAHELLANLRAEKIVDPRAEKSALPAE
jgi:biopolymer transport protein ExbB